MGRRGNGEGGITRHKKSGLYMARYTVHAAAGPKRKTIYGKTRSEVAAKLSKALTPDHVRGLYRKKLDGGLAPQTVLHIHRTLSKALKQAVEDGLIPRNAAAPVKPPRPSREEIRPLNLEQVRALFEAAREDRLEALYVVAVTTGLRRGELQGLKWEDLDLEA